MNTLNSGQRRVIRPKHNGLVCIKDVLKKCTKEETLLVKPYFGVFIAARGCRLAPHQHQFVGSELDTSCFRE